MPNKNQSKQGKNGLSLQVGDVWYVVSDEHLLPIGTVVCVNKEVTQKDVPVWVRVTGYEATLEGYFGEEHEFEDPVGKPFFTIRMATEKVRP